jgi:hypothetical protein
MVGRPRSEGRERDPLVRHHIDPDEPVSEALLRAFERLDGGVPEDEPIYDWLDLDAVELLFREPAGEPSVTATVWGHTVVLTPEFVEIRE